MEEITAEIERRITLLKLTIRWYQGYGGEPYMNECDRLYRLLMYQKELEDWQCFVKLVRKYNTSTFNGTLLEVGDLADGLLPSKNIINGAEKEWESQEGNH